MVAQGNTWCWLFSAVSPSQPVRVDWQEARPGRRRFGGTEVAVDGSGCLEATWRATVAAVARANRRSQTLTKPLLSGGG